MWETMATTRGQDRALHGAAKALNVLVGFFAIPAWLIGQRLSIRVRRALLERAEHEPLPLPAPAERSMDALMDELEAIPHRLQPSAWGETRKGLRDLTSFALAQTRQGLDVGYSYPAQFNDEWFIGADGEHIGASVAVHPEPRPGLIVVHGLFSSRRFDYVREIAVRAFYEWGFNVCAIDLRSFGASAYLSRAPSTAGWKEGEDVVCAARFLKGAGATTVGALGISLGGSSVLGACHLEGAEEALDGGVIAIAAPADTHYMVRRISRPRRRDRAYDPMAGLQAMLRSRIHASRWPVDFENFADPIEQLAAPYYGVEPAVIWERSSARNTISGARVPVLVLHSADDWLVPVGQAETLREAAAGNELVRVWTVAAGGHGAADAIDERWAYAVYRRFFERWAGYPDREAGEVVYSPAIDGKVQARG
jgi:predicted alpha/beta-fold hydrolase